MAFIGNFVSLLTQILTIAILIRVILSWFPINPHNTFVALLYQITEPLLGPLRRVLPRLGVLDLSPLVAVIILWAIARLAARL